MRQEERLILLRGLARWTILTVLVLASSLPFNVRGQTYATGDVFVAIGSSRVQWRKPDGTLFRVLTAGVTPNTYTAGMAFDADGHLYVTMFDSSTVAHFDNTGNFVGTFGSGYSGQTESILFDGAGNVYVGAVDGDNDIRKFDEIGTPLGRFNVVTGPRGSDWIDLAADQCTMYHTSEGKAVHVFDVCDNRQLADFNKEPLPGNNAFALRLLPSGGLLVADRELIVRLNASGEVVQTYDAPGEDFWFALNLDPDGTSFWSGGISSHNVYKFDIETGAVLLSFNAGEDVGDVGGITVYGEITVSAILPSDQCVTRDARYWFTHVTNAVPECATLRKGIGKNGSSMGLGFLGLPVLPRYGNTVNRGDVTLIETLGFFWLSQRRTGENGGTQGSHLRGSKLCRERKRLASELIAATCNTKLLRTSPANCAYNDGGTVTNFSARLISDARLAARGENSDEIRAMTLLLKKFNSSGLTNDFLDGLVECTGSSRKAVRALARDATRQDTCPGRNDTCNAAETAFSVPFRRSVNLTVYANDFDSPTCGNGGGVDAVYKLTPPLAAPNRHFTINTAGSNFDTLISIWSGPNCSNLNAVACNDNAANFTMQSSLGFRTSGSNTYYIVVEGAGGQVGSARVRITSP